MIENIEEYINSVNKLNSWAYAYYVEDNPLVTDEVYDKLYNKVLEFEKRNKSLIIEDSPTQRVGDVLKITLKKAKHLSRMWSMEDISTNEELKRWYERVSKSISKFERGFYIEPKFDGASLNLIYENGILKKAITRGDGVTGEDVTLNAKTIKTIPQEIRYKELIEIRGEVLMSFSQFEKINRERLKESKPLFANPRNSASGSLRQQNPKITKDRNLIFQVWGVGKNSLQYENLSEVMDFIYSLGFAEPPIRGVSSSLEEIEDFYNQMANLRAKLNIMLDGMVVKVNSISAQKSLGHTQKYPKWMVAYKFPPIERETTLKDITWQVGRTGVLTPVAELEPIEIDGVTVSRATLNNFEYIKKLDIRIEDRVNVIRSGDVIPKIVGVVKSLKRDELKPISKPLNCPVCKERLLDEQILIKCQNLSCSARVINSVVHFTSKFCMNIRGFGESVTKSLYKSGIIKDIEDIYHLNLDSLTKIDRFGEKRAKNLLKEIEKSKGRECWRFLNGLGVEHIGEVISKKICSEFGLRFLDLSKDELLKIEGVGEEVSNSFLKFMDINRVKVQNLLELTSPIGDVNVDIDDKKVQNSIDYFKDKTVVLTGKMDKPRDEVKSILRNLGAKVTSSISKKTDYLIYGEKAGSKYKKALHLGIKTISEREFTEILNSKK